MRVPLSWLNDYVRLPDGPGIMVERLTLAGLEAAGVEVFGKSVPDGLRVKPEDAGLVWPADRVVLAKVLKIEKHPQADKLKMVTVDYGAAEPKTVITGAPNIAPGESGMKVVLGLRGTQYYYTDKEGKRAIFTLEPKELRGIMNDAMCMSNFELGIAEDHDGIIILDDGDPAPGTPIQNVLGEIVIDLDVLPNMARCLGILGVAREVAALCGGEVCEPALIDVAASAGDLVQVQIENADKSARYSATIIHDLVVGHAPRWMRSRLHYAGVRPINNVVDITNYVMLEFGQPLHAFDYDVLVKRAGGGVPAISVRTAKSGEKLVTLDGVERELAPANLVIADVAGPIALAGVMGGAETEVTATTKSILLESASFDAVSVRQTARQFNLFSEASTRFSRGIHPEIVPLAARRAALLLQIHAHAKVVGSVESYPAPLRPTSIELKRSEIERILGITLPDGEVERVLTALQFQIESTPWGWQVTPPANRLDIQAGAADLIEELARVSGYDRLTGRLLSLELPEPNADVDLANEERIRDRLVDLGLFECINYALTSPEIESKLLLASTTEFVSLINPGAPERSVLRRSLLPGLLGVAGHNWRNKETSIALFEIGPIFEPKVNELPEEPSRLGIVMLGERGTHSWQEPPNQPLPKFNFYDMKGVIEALLEAMHIVGVSIAAKSDVPYLHPGRAASISVSAATHGMDLTLGVFGELHPKVASAFGLTEPIPFVAELDMNTLLTVCEISGKKYQYRPISPFPPVLRDIAVVLGDDVLAESVRKEIIATGGDLLESVRLFDVYRGESIAAGTKSLAFALSYRVADRQLNDKEVDKTHQKIEGRLKTAFKAQIRGKEGT